MVRLTSAVAKVLAVMLTQGGEHYGLTLAQATGLASGTLYPIFARLEAAGVVSCRNEEVPPGQNLGRPLRRYYQLTPAGADFASTALTKVRAEALAMTRLLNGPGQQVAQHWVQPHRR